MKQSLIHTVPDDAVEITVPKRCNTSPGRPAVCLCCGQAGQPMDDDGCGICDACLGLAACADDDADGLEILAVPPHLSLTARHR